MREDFDVFVIGSGIAGQTVATNCAKNGLKVGIADDKIYGGTCANRGCDPKKILYGSTESVFLNSNFQDKNILEKTKIDWKALQKFKKELTGAVPASTEKKLLELDIKLYHQSPYFINKHTLSVEGKTVTSKNIVIATGLEPRMLDIEGSQHLKTSRDFLNLKTLKESITFIGAGYIGMEFAHMAARAGSKVTVIESGNSILNPFDQDLAQKLIDYSRDLGIKFVFNTTVSKIELLKKNYRISYTGDEAKNTLKSGMVFNTTGRVASVDKLKLSNANVEYSERGVEVNEYLETINESHIYACGDVSSLGLPLTPLSSPQGKIVAHNILKNTKRTFESGIIPSSVFTIPNLAMVGLTEKQARERYKDIEVRFEDASDWFSAKHLNISCYSFKTIVNKNNDQILGAHVLSPTAAEVINLFAMAVQLKLTRDQIKNLNFTYPTWSNNIKLML